MWEIFIHNKWPEMVEGRRRYGHFLPTIIWITIYIHFAKSHFNCKVEETLVDFNWGVSNSNSNSNSDSDFRFRIQIQIEMGQFDRISLQPHHTTRIHRKHLKHSKYFIHLKYSKYISNVSNIYSYLEKIYCFQ